MLKQLRRIWIVLGLELKKIWRARLIQMILLAFAFLVVIKRGANWTDYIDNGLMFLVAVIGLVGFGTLSSWVFANEFTSQTFKDLLALPISRKTIVSGKLVAIEIAELLITVGMLGFLFGFGCLYFHSGIPAGLVAHVLALVRRAFVYDVMLSFLWPLVATLSRTSLLPMALSFSTLIIAVIFASQPLGQFIPWAIPGYFLAHTEAARFINNLIVSLVGMIGIYGTIYVWDKWDQMLCGLVELVLLTITIKSR